MTDSLPQLNHYLDLVFQHGVVWVYVVLFVTCFIENVFPPFPGDSFVIAAGGLVGVGRLHYLPTMLVILAGGMSSVMLLYLLGRNYGRDFFIRKNFKYFSAADVVAMEARLQKWGMLVLLISRFLVGIRSAVALAAGIGRYPIARMFLWTVISYAAFVSLWILIGMKVIAHFDMIAHYWKAYNRIIWPIIILLILGWLASRYWKMKRKS